MTRSGAIWYHEAGPDDAPLIVLIHGAMDRSASMIKVSRQLDDEFRVLRYDRRGYGRSKPHPGPFTMDGHVADLVDLLGGRPALAFGHSYGGNVALATAARHPDLVRAVAVYEAPLSWLDWWPGLSRRGGGTAPSPEEAAERFMRRMVGAENWEGLPTFVQGERRAEGVALVGELTDLVAGAPWTPDRIGVPVVAMHGEGAAEHHRSATEHVAEQLSQEPAVTIAGAGHNGPFTHPAAVAAVLRRLAAAIAFPGHAGRG